jgi:asparagine synthase (glutamine-hydrolysing)
MIDFVNNNVSEKVIRKMGETMSHRGPDQNGVYMDKSVAFQHNRLAIIDIQNGIQPMTRIFEGREYTIVYNGEIYNTPELTKELSEFGVEMQTRCDTEAVLYAYIIFKEKCPEKLNGIFAFAVYDKAENKVFIARDRFGIKPLFYTQIGSILLFASEIKALFANPQVKRDVDYDGLWQLLYLSPVKLNGSGIFKDIHEVKPAQCGYFSENKLTLDYYWKLCATELHVTSDEAAEQTKLLLTDAIERQLVSDAPLCTFLSGGLDSSVITSAASKHLRKKGEILSTYSFEYEGNKENFKSTLFQPQGDDEYAVYLADYLKTDHTVITAPTQAVADLLTNAVSARDIPGQADIDSSLLYFCSIIKQRHTVALSGECADEIFGGYPWFYRKEMLEKDFFPWIHDPFKRISLFNSDIVKSSEGYSYLSEKYKSSLNECPVLDTDSESMLLSRRATWLSVSYFMTSLLERKDRMSMASGVEVRVPFADHRILEFIYNIPWEIKFENQVEKALLRKAMSDFLPDKILNRKKSPYPKTHNPQYEKIVYGILKNRLGAKGSLLNQILCKENFEKFLESGNTTWFGQLMSKPQLLAWLIQLDFWFEMYNINLLL